MDNNKILFKEIVESCDSTVVTCPSCKYRVICKQIAENHVGKPYQYINNEYTKNKTVAELLEEVAI